MKVVQVVPVKTSLKLGNWPYRMNAYTIKLGYVAYV